MSINLAGVPTPFMHQTLDLLDEDPVTINGGMVDLWCYDPSHPDGVGGDSGNDLGGGNNMELTPAGAPAPGPLTSTTAKFFRCLPLASANAQYLFRADETALRYTGGDVTFAAWVRPASFTSGVVLSKRNDTLFEYELGFNGVTDRFYWIISDGTKLYQVVAGGHVFTGTWYLLIAYFDSKSGRAGLHINAAAAVEVTGVAGVTAAGAQFRIGARGGATPAYWNGRLEAVARWNRLLSVAEKASL